MWLKLANATFSVNLGQMSVLSNSISIKYNGLNGAFAINKSSVSKDDTSAELKLTLNSGWTCTSASATVTGATETSDSYSDGVLTINITPSSGTTFGDSGKTEIVIAVTHDAISNSTGGGGSEGDSSTYTFTINPTPTFATVTLTASGYVQSGNSITVANGTTVSWRVSADGYTGQSGTWIANGSNESKSVTLNAVVVDGSTTWYVDHRNNAGKFTASVNIAGRGWCHVPGSAAYEAYVGKPVNTVGFFTNKASQEVTISKVIEKGGEADMTEIATVTLTNPAGTTKGFCSVSFPTVTLTDGECLAVYTQTDSDIQFYYLSSNGPTTDANGIADGQFYGRVPKVYGSGIAWTSYDDKLTLGMSVGYNSEIA